MGYFENVQFVQLSYVTFLHTQKWHRIQFHYHVNQSHAEDSLGQPRAQTLTSCFITVVCIHAKAAKLENVPCKYIFSCVVTHDQYKNH